jgi:hypothetical protein
LNDEELNVSNRTHHGTEEVINSQSDKIKNEEIKSFSTSRKLGSPDSTSHNMK